jgi:hypothetical protein
MWMVALLFIVAVFAYAVHRTAYSIEARDLFCVSCALCRRDHARRDAIRRALHEINWVLGGPHGHAHDTPIADARHRSVDGLS